MIERLTVDCGSCNRLIPVTLETEDCGAGSEHEVTCPYCCEVVHYEIVHNLGTHTIDPDWALKEGGDVQKPLTPDAQWDG